MAQPRLSDSLSELTCISMNVPGHIPLRQEHTVFTAYLFVKYVLLSHHLQGMSVTLVVTDSVKPQAVIPKEVVRLYSPWYIFEMCVCLKTEKESMQAKVMCG